ncbi:methyl-accepting chemotaxis protein [Paraburkholderia sp. WC7.3g]|uniref:HAMP domain-containing protein n=1 Tax=Paraburkholderia sp. WC7.3g TaxID=2991070 RepID=UPI003D247F8B
MLKSVRIPTALTMAVGAGVIALLGTSALGSALAYTAAKVLDMASVMATRAHDTDALARLDDVRHMLQGLVRCLAVLVTAGLVAAVVARRWLSHQVIAPLDDAMRAVTAVAQGDLRKKVLVDEKTQARRLFSSLAQMQHALITTISLVKTETVVIDGNASALASQNRRLGVSVLFMLNLAVSSPSLYL